MIKIPLILVSYFGLFLMSIFSTEDVLVENNIPATIAPGAKSLVQLTINKGDIQGFSILELDLPTGFTASPADILGASFTFSNQKAKFVWMTLPSEANFTISYYIESAENLEGPFSIDGGFSYVKNNKRVDISIPSKTVLVQKELEPTVAQVAETLPALKREAEVVEMLCTRTVSKVTDSEYVVNLKVNNNNIKGFGKILETLPENCKAEKVNDGGAVVTQDENTIKFVWFEVPAAESFEVSYKISCITATPSPVIVGQLSFTENGNPVTANVLQVDAPSDMATNTTVPTSTTEVPDTAEFDVPPPDQTNPQTINTTTTTNTTEPTTAAIEPTPDPVNNTSNSGNNTVEPKQNPVSASNNITPEKQVTSIPSAETGITYKVQILAAHRVVDKSYFQNKFGFNEKFNIENHEGWVKYTTGKYSEYKDARDARQKITSESGKLPGPFVTAYNDGERITVQEALLISKQQWYQ